MAQTIVSANEAIERQTHSISTLCGKLIDENGKEPPLFLIVTVEDDKRNTETGQYYIVIESDTPGKLKRMALPRTIGTDPQCEGAPRIWEWELRWGFWEEEF